MATNFNKRKKNLLALFLSFMMVSSTAVGLTSCTEETDGSSSSSSSSTSTTETDSSHITNGSFEYTDIETKKPVVTSPTGWSIAKNSGADTSATASGVLDVSEDAWDNLTKTALTVDAPTTADGAKALWDTMSTYDKLKFYKTWEDGDNDEDYDELDFFDKATDDFNIDFEDVPSCQNPGVNPEAKAGDTQILMLHNSYGSNKGTAQKATSSTTITVSAGTSAVFSVWVKTSDLKHLGGNVIGNRGAYIGVTHTVGGTTLDELQVKNINTKADESAQNGWVKYEFLFRGCSFADSTFTVVLGLGRGNSDNIHEYVEGYAFFDDITCSVITNEEFETSVAQNAPVVTLDSTAEEKIFYADAANKDDKQFVIDLYTDFEDYTLPISDGDIALTSQKKGNDTYVSAEDGDASTVVYGQLGAGFDVSRDVLKVNKLDSLKASDNAFLKARLAEDFGENYPFGDQKILMMMSAGGASYTAKLTDSRFTLDKGEYVAISFFVKTSNMQGVTGATVTLREGANAHAIEKIDTTGITTVDVDEQENIYDGWQQCFFFVENDTEKDGLTFTLEFTLGPTEIVGTTKASYYPGYAAFTGFQINTLLTKQEYGYVSSGTYAKTVSLTDENETTYSENVFDAPAYVPTNAIETGIAQLKNYTGVYGGSAYVNGAEGLDETANGEKDYAGLISKEYIENYVEQARKVGENYWLNKMSLNKASLTALLDDATQPLLIYNNQEQAYGFIGSETNLSASVYTAISVRMKVSQGATATVYLTDTSDLSHESKLSVGRQISYWYDADGNVCASDPTAKDFNKKTDVAFYLGDNGLYTVNKKWSGYSANLDGKYFANLANYEKDSNGNLVVAEGGVSYDYDSAWDNEGLDGIAYYAGENGKFFADRKKTVEVLDLSTVSALAPRYTSVSENKELFATVTGDAEVPVWKTVTFYVHAGATDKTYRLEVWSGSRDGAIKNVEGSYVLFDANTVGTIDQTKFEALRDEVVETIMDENGYATKEAFEAGYTGVLYNAFSFFDQPTFLRYNATIDENEVGNSYDNYNATYYTATLSYLFHETSEETFLFADWAANDVTVDPDPVEDDDDHDHDHDHDHEEAAPTDGTNALLLAGSIAICVAMLVAIVGMALRPVFKKANRAKAKRAAAPKKERKEKAQKAPKKADDVKDEKDPYND
ncbi:MAG: hypothetical protein IJX81_04430 [Clostridia bacterium]|nr:hypothetical protein [Clostridia bacterium]